MDLMVCLSFFLWPWWVWTAWLSLLHAWKTVVHVVKRSRPHEMLFFRQLLYCRSGQKVFWTHAFQPVCGQPVVVYWGFRRVRVLTNGSHEMVASVEKEEEDGVMAVSSPLVGFCCGSHLFAAVVSWNSLGFRSTLTVLLYQSYSLVTLLISSALMAYFSYKVQVYNFGTCNLQRI